MIIECDYIVVSITDEIINFSELEDEFQEFVKDGKKVSFMFEDFDDREVWQCDNLMRRMSLHIGSLMLNGATIDNLHDNVISWIFLHQAWKLAPSAIFFKDGKYFTPKSGKLFNEVIETSIKYSLALYQLHRLNEEMGVRNAIH